MRVAPLAITDEAQALLRSTRADFARIATPIVSGRGTFNRGSALGGYDFAQVRSQSEYLRLVSIVEAYLDTCSSQQFDLRTRGHSDFFQVLASQASEYAARGWEERKEAFKIHHGFALGECARWSDIDAAREARNAIAHGLGRLTARQQNAKTRKKIEAVKIFFHGNQLIIDGKALDRLVTSSVEFILDVDRKLKIRS